MFENQILFLDFSEKKEKPETADCGETGDVQPVKVNRRIQSRFDEPVQVEPADCQHEHNHAEKTDRDAFAVAAQQKKKGNEEVADRQQHAQNFPAIGKTFDVPGRFFRQVAIPDDDEL